MQTHSNHREFQSNLTFIPNEQAHLPTRVHHMKTMKVVLCRWHLCSSYVGRRSSNARPLCFLAAIHSLIQNEKPALLKPRELSQASRVDFGRDSVHVIVGYVERCDSFRISDSLSDC